MYYNDYNRTDDLFPAPLPQPDPEPSPKKKGSWRKWAALCLVCALLGGPIWLQIGLFLVVSVLCLLAVRPLAKKFINNKVQPTNADRILGTEAQVTENIDNIQGKGAVTIGGVAWSARSEDGTPIPAGSLVRILRIEGVKVFVELSKEESVCH